MTRAEARTALLRGMASYLRSEMTTHTVFATEAFKLGIELSALRSSHSTKPSKNKVRK